MRKYLMSVLLLVIALVTVLLLRALPAGQAGNARTNTPDTTRLDTQQIARHLSAAIQIPTITDDRPMAERAAEFERFHAFLAATYPFVFSRLQREVIGGHSLLFTWHGANKSLKPMLLMGHMDVVPVAPGSESSWKQPPFSGAIVQGEVWGRGALDDKQHVISILEAVEHLLGRDFTPERPVLLFFGHDEEGAGIGGARVAAELLAQRGVQLEFALDEGGIISEGVLAGVERPLALVRTAEKGYLTLQLSVQGAGGHSSAPARSTTIGILARALTALEANPFPQRITPPLRGMLETAAGEMPLLQRLVLRNLWLFEPLVLRQMAKQPSTDAVTRTTIAPTMLQASPKDNVLPVSASATINFRVLPGETSESVIAHVREAVADERVKIKALTVSEPPPAAALDGPQFHYLKQTIQQLHPDVMVSSLLLGAATDVRHFSRLTPNTFGFSNARGGSDLLSRAHGTDERIAIDDMVNNVRFYQRLIQNSK